MIFFIHTYFVTCVITLILTYVIVGVYVFLCNKHIVIQELHNEIKSKNRLDPSKEPLIGLNEETLNEWNEEILKEDNDRLFDLPFDYGVVIGLCTGLLFAAQFGLGFLAYFAICFQLIIILNSCFTLMRPDPSMDPSNDRFKEWVARRAHDNYHII